MKHTGVLFILTIFFYACSNDPNGYTNYHKGLKYKLIQTGINSQEIKDGSYIKGMLTISDGTNIIFNNKAPVWFRKERNTPIDQLLENFNPEDSLIMMIDPELTHIHESSIDVFLDERLDVDSILLRLKIMEVVTTLEFKKDSARYFTNPIHNERRLIRQTVAHLDMDSSRVYRNLYFKYLKSNPTGKKAVRGDQLRIEYTGRFLDGRIFDSTKRWDEDFVVQYGKPFQVIKGFEIILSSLREGEVVKIILPSQLAFGKSGSESARVPPNTPVQYELKLLEIIKNPI